MIQQGVANRKRKVGKPLVPPVLVVLLLLCGIAVAAYILTEKEVQLVDDGVSRTVLTRASTVGDLLEQQGIVLAELDVVEPGIEAGVDEEVPVVIKRAFDVAVTADFATHSYPTQPQTVRSFLAANGVTLGENDWVSPSLDTVLAKGDNIVINRITYRTTQTKEPVSFKTVRKEDNTLTYGKTKVVKPGVKGEKTMTNLVTYKDGVPIAKQELSRAVTKEPVAQVVAVGTKRVISRGGQTYEYTKVMSMKATAYTHTGSRTATGTNPKAGFTVAVDPKEIPLGSKLYVDGYGYAKAEDTGGAIKGKKIDLFFDTERECVNWGVQNVRVYVLK